MSKASTFVQNMPHEAFMNALEDFCHKKEVARLMTYGIEELTAEEKDNIKDAITTLGAKDCINNDSDLDAFCVAIHRRAVRENG